MIKMFCIILLACANCFCMPYKVLDPIDDPNLSVAAKALYLCIISQEPPLDPHEYIRELLEDDIFYLPLRELIEAGYL